MAMQVANPAAGTSAGMVNAASWIRHPIAKPL